MTSGLALLRNDLRLQLRHGLYGAYAFVAVAYIVLLRALPTATRALALPPLLLTECSVIGFFFAGTLLLLERGNGTLDALAVTPLTPAIYIASKMVTLATLTCLTALAVTLATAPFGVHAIELTVAAALTSAVFTALGVAFAARASSLERFVLLGGLFSALLALPVLPYLGVLPSPLWVLVPTQPALLLFADAVGFFCLARAGPPLFAALLAAWAVPAFLLARRAIERPE